MSTLPKTNTEPTSGEKRFAQEMLLHGEPPLWMQWVTKRKRDKVQDRLLVVGKYRVFSIKRTLTGKKQVQRMGHFFDLKEIYSGDVDKTVFKFRDFEIDIQGPGAGSELIQKIRECMQVYTCSFADYAMPRIVLLPADRALPPLSTIDPGPAHGLLYTYEAYCEYYNIAPSEEFKKFVLDLTNQGITDLVLDECPGIERKENAINFVPIKAALRHNTYFTSFIFKNILRRDVSESLSDTLTHNITMKKLLLNSCDAREESFVNIGASLKKNLLNDIIDLDFSNNPIKDRGATGLADGLQFMTHSLWRLKLTNCGISPKGCAAIMQAFCFGKDVAKNIQEIDLSYNNIGQAGTVQMCNWFNQATVNCQLRYLLLANSKVDLQLLFRSLKNATVRSLEEIDISGNKVDQASAFAIASVIDTLPKLVALNMSYCNMATKEVETILRSINGNASTDICLNFSYNDIGVQGAVTIAQFLLNAGNVGALILRGCGFKKEGLTKIVDALGQNLDRTRLRVLDLGFNFHQGTSAKMMKLIASLGEAVKKHPYLEYLGLAGDNNKAAIGKELEPLFKALSSNPNLAELDITGNKIGDQLAVVLSDNLRLNTKLRSLSWDLNNISIGGWRALLNILGSNRTLCHCPSPNADIDKAIKEAKNRDQFRDKTKEVIDQIRDVLKQNSGGAVYTSISKLKQGKTFRDTSTIVAPLTEQPTAQFYENQQLPPANFRESGSFSSYGSSDRSATFSSGAAPPAPPIGYGSLPAPPASTEYRAMTAPPPLSTPSYGGGSDHYVPAPSTSNYESYDSGGYDAPPPPPPPPGASADYHQSHDYGGGSDYGYDQAPPAYDYPVEFDDSQYDDAPPPPPPPPF